MGCPLSGLRQELEIRYLNTVRLWLRHDPVVDAPALIANCDCQQELKPRHYQSAQNEAL
jgi:hypothetical protein